MHGCGAQQLLLVLALHGCGASICSNTMAVDTFYFLCCCFFSPGCVCHRSRSSSLHLPLHLRLLSEEREGAAADCLQKLRPQTRGHCQVWIVGPSTLAHDAARLHTPIQLFGVPLCCRDLDLKRPIYQKTACYGHFGRKEFPWEVPKNLEF